MLKPKMIVFFSESDGEGHMTIKLGEVDSSEAMVIQIQPEDGAELDVQ